MGGTTLPQIPRRSAPRNDRLSQPVITTINWTQRESEGWGKHGSSLLSDLYPVAEEQPL